MAEKWVPIKLSAKVFGHLSQGLYRTPAGAIKELISNSYDADARLVRIHTDFPRFDSFSCEDTGSGMSREEFNRLMDRGIGNSFKRTVPMGSATASGRPYIGRLGLGILALAQICSQFEIVSHHKATKKAFKAVIRFPAYTREEIDKLSADDGVAVVEGGEYSAADIDFSNDKPGLRIFTDRLRESYRKRMRSLSLYGNKDKVGNSVPYKSFDQFLTRVYAGPPAPPRSLNLLSDYDQLIFGIALAPPLLLPLGRNVAYELPAVAKRQDLILKYDFSVRVDNLELRNPVCLPSDQKKQRADQCIVAKRVREEFELLDGAFAESVSVERFPVSVKNSDDKFNLYEFGYDKTVAGRPLEFSGYLFQQTGRLYPRDIQGILIRINGVAIGKYDNNLLAYPYAEGPRYSMVSGELFIARGFEDGLNIDRDSFNELHPHYVRVQSFIHGLLHEKIFPETWTEEKSRNKNRRSVAVAQSSTRFVGKLSEATGDAFRSVKDIAEDVERRPVSKSPVNFVKTKREIQVDRRHPLLKALLKRAKYAPLMEHIAIAFERAISESTPSRRRDLFYRLLTDIVNDL